MKLVKEERTIRDILEGMQDGSINTEHILQRKAGQFSVQQKSLLIDSIFRGYPIPPIYIFKENDGKEYVLDGKQRLTTIYEYMEAKTFALDGDFAPVTCILEDETAETYDISKIDDKVYNNLPNGMKKFIRSAKLDFHIFTDCTDEQIDEIFYRLNNGVTLNTPQKVKCFTDKETKEAIQKILNMYLFKEVINFTSKQILSSEDEITVLQILMLNKGEYDFRRDGITDFVKNYTYNEADFTPIEKAVEELGDFFKVIETTDEKDSKKKASKAKKNASKAKKNASKAKKSAFKKIAVATAIAAYMSVKDKDKEAYKVALNKFFDTYKDNPEFGELVKGGTATSTNVQARYAYFKDIVKKMK